MIEVSRGLEPLKEAEAAIAKLQDYESSSELASAVQATHAAVQRSLRYLLRADRGAPDDLRLVALSPSELAPDRLIPALRQRKLISLDLAGQIHELEQSALRAERGSTRAADGDLAFRVVDQLRAEILELGERPVRDVAHGAVEAGALDEVHAVPMAGSSRSPVRVLAIGLGAVLLGLLVWLLFFHKSASEQGIAQFQRGEYERSEQTLREVVEEDPGDAQAAFYLAVLYRRSQRNEDASRVLRRAIEKNPSDALLREEMGNLFMSLDHPDLAAKQFRIAQEQDPDNPRYWIKLIAALRAAGDPAADEVLQRAPAEARAMLRTTQ
jgi:tetratricopeptide (TPR) repeat protein